LQEGWKITGEEMKNLEQHVWMQVKTRNILFGVINQIILDNKILNGQMIVSVLCDLPVGA